MALSGPRTRRFWDERAEENALYFVDNRLDYAEPDEARFWDEGTRALDSLLGELDVQVRPSDTVVDIGCGVGRLTRALAARAARVVALDVSERMLDRARALNPELQNVEWILGDGRSLRGIPDASADACVSLVVFQHLPDPALTYGYVREMGRVLRPGGWSAFQVSNDPALHEPVRGRRGLALALRSLVGRAPRGQRAPEWLGSAVDVDDLRAAAAAGPLEVERVVGEGTQWCLVLARRRA